MTPRRPRLATAALAAATVTGLLAGCSTSPEAGAPTGTSAAPGRTTGTTTAATGGTTEGTTRRPGTTTPATTPSDGTSDVEGIGQDHAFPDLGDPGIDVQQYRLHLDYDPDTDALTASADLDLRAATADLATVRLDLRGLTVDDVTVDGAAAAFASSDDHRKLEVTLDHPAAAGDRLSLTVRYHGTPKPVATAALGGVEVGWHSGAGGSFVVAEPEGASSWYPVNDHPLDKATYRFDVTVPQPYEAVANGRLTGTDDAGDRRTYHWTMDRPMAPYLATVVTGRLEAHDHGEQGGVAYTDWLPADQADLDAAFDDQQDVVRTLAGHLGAFPFTTYGAVVYPADFIAGSTRTKRFLSGVALEAQGRSLYAEAAADPSVVWHETAHQWMGDNVSLSDWSRDIWWVEGFASFAEHVPELDRRGPDALRPTYASAWRDRSGNPPGRIPVDELFSERSYQGGALVFYALLREVGEDDFWTILRTFNEQHRYGNATTDDLIDVASSVAGRDLRPFFEAWLFADDPPPLP